MRELLVKTNYEILLFHFVDSISQWNIFVGPHLSRYFDEYFGYNDEDREQLNKYKKVRSKLGWKAESPLLDWAYENFPNNDEFNPLKFVIEYFETRISKDGDSLRDILSTRLSDINELMSSSELVIFKQKQRIDDVVVKISKLLEYHSDNEDAITAYLACSMNKSTQGGANGDRIYTEVPLVDDINYVNDVTSGVLIHEYFHKAFVPQEFFKKQGKEFEYCNEKRYPDRMDSFFEEVLVYCCSTVYISGRNPKRMLDRYSKENKFNKNRTLWTVIDEFYPLIENYLNDNLSVEEARKEMLKLCDEVIKDFKE